MTDLGTAIDLTTVRPLREVPQPRERCDKCGKVIMRDQAHAESAIGYAAARGQKMKWYLGRCGHLHLARDKKRSL